MKPSYPSYPDVEYFGVTAEEDRALRAVCRDGTLLYGTDVVSQVESSLNTRPGLTVQDEQLNTDINEIVRRLGIGQMPLVNVRVPMEDDFVDITDFHSAQNALVRARESFDALPADIRSRFRNDPGLFFNFCVDPGNLEELRKMGLAVPAKVNTELPHVDSEAVDDRAAAKVAKDVRSGEEPGAKAARKGAS